MAASTVTDIRLQVTFFTNRKVKLLQRKLGADGVLSLLRLWCYCASNEPDGAMIGWTEDEVECAADWDGMRGAFVSHSLACGLLDPLKDGGYQIHDWSENQPWAAQSTERSARAKAAAIARWDRHKAKLNDADGMQGACDPHATSNAPFLSLPSLTLPEEKHSAQSEADCAAIEHQKPARKQFPEADWQRFWARWSHKVGKAAAKKAFPAALKRAGGIETLLAGVDTVEGSDAWQRGAQMHPATFLNGNRWEDEAGEKVQGVSGVLRIV